jgi:Raf kinase inhibitor-like YbhB/YbcL family protein
MLENLPEPLGRSLAGQRAGMDKVALQRLLRQRSLARLEVRSVAFENGMPLPLRFTADGDGSSPPLSWHGVPATAASTVLIVEDADSPTPQPLVHAIAVNLAAADGALVEGALVEGALSRNGGTPKPVETGINSFLRHGWLPPDPPPGHGEHHYVFQFFALGPGPAFARVPGRQALFDAIAERAVAGGMLIGTYERPHRQRIDAARTAQPADEPAVALMGEGPQPA